MRLSECYYGRHGAQGQKVHYGEDFARRWLLDPVIGRLVALVVGLLVIVVVVRLVNRSLKRIVRDSRVRYRSRKSVVFIGYVIAALVVSTVYSNRLGGLTVAFGVAGAGIAFALQEVIASVAGWVAISFAGFYNPGDRVQLGGIKGDVIDVSVPARRSWKSASG